MRNPQLDPTSDGNSAVEHLVVVTIARLTARLGLRECWFEPFPFDVQLPRIEPGRIVLPAEEPGVGAWSLDGRIELPVRFSELTVGRFVLVPSTPTTGVNLSPALRTEAISRAACVGAVVGAALCRAGARQASR